MKPVEKKLKQIKRPAKLTNLQAAMSLGDDKRSYSHCLVSFFFTVQLELESNNYNRQLFETSRRVQVYQLRVTGEIETHRLYQKWLKW